MTNFRKTIHNSTFTTPKREFSVANFRKVISSKNFLSLLKVYTPFLILLLIAGLQQVVPAQILTRDIFVTTKAPVYTGFISNISILTWCVGFAICAFTFLLIKPRNSQDKKIKAFIGLSGLISFWMMVDDLFMLHEQVIPKYAGIPEKLVVLSELVWVVFHLIYFRKIILKSTPFKLLGFALLLFFLSLAVDLLPLKLHYYGSQSNWFFIVEDGSKLMGIITWAFYFYTVCSQQINGFQKHTYLRSNFSSLPDKN